MHTDPEQRQEPSAAVLFEQSIEELRATAAENELALALAGYGRLQRRLGVVVKARELLREAKEIFERLGTMHEPEKVARELAALPS
jgi:hypothetical protein